MVLHNQMYDGSGGGGGGERGAVEHTRPRRPGHPLTTPRPCADSARATAAGGTCTARGAPGAGTARAMPRDRGLRDGHRAAQCGTHGGAHWGRRKGEPPAPPPPPPRPCAAPPVRGPRARRGGPAPHPMPSHCPSTTPISVDCFGDTEGGGGLCPSGDLGRAPPPHPTPREIREFSLVKNATY